MAAAYALAVLGVLAAAIYFAIERRPFRHSQRWAFMRHMVIDQGGEPYLRRLYLVRTPWFQVMLHWIYQPDKDRAPHDHPWWFVSFILVGSYIEVHGTIDESGKWLKRTQRRLCRWLSWKNSRDAHRILWVRSSFGWPVMTLVITGPRRKGWGFYEVNHKRNLRKGDGAVPVTFTPWTTAQGQRDQ